MIAHVQEQGWPMAISKSIPSVQNKYFHLIQLQTFWNSHYFIQQGVTAMWIMPPKKLIQTQGDLEVTYMSFSQHPASPFSAMYVITILNCICCHKMQLRAQLQSVLRGEKIYRREEPCSDSSWLVSNNFRKSEISLEAVNCNELCVGKNVFTSCPSTGSCQLMGIDIPYHLFLYLRSPLPPYSPGQMQAFLIIFLPCMCRHLEMQKLKTVQKKVLAVFVCWLNGWGKRIFIRAGGSLRKLPYWT